jgi:hypothetical protein
MDRGASRKRPFCFLSVALIFCTGCLRVAPKIPKVIGSPAISYATQDFDADVQGYRTDVAGASSGQLAQYATRLSIECSLRLMPPMEVSN